MSLLYPSIPGCIRCGRDLPGGDLCPACARKLQKAAFFSRAVEYPFPCYGAYRYTSAVRRILHRFKFEDARYLAAHMGARIYEAVRHLPIDAVCFIPLHSKRLRQRGYNQAALLAQEVARRMELPCLDILLRDRHTGVQSRLPHGKRLKNVDGAFSLQPNPGIHGLKLLLIDDVVTTGATVLQCIRLLEGADAAVFCAAYAVVPGAALQFSEK